MNTHDDVVEKFRQMGARVQIERVPTHLMGRAWNGQRRTASPDRFRIDIQRKGDLEVFTIRHRTDVQLRVLDVKGRDRHLLLCAQADAHGPVQRLRSKFLCGHDERAWFVAAIPESMHADSVQDAKDALKPQAVWDSLREHRVPMEHRDRRRTPAFVRQGEWFFIPRPTLKVVERRVLKREPIRRGAGKPHICQFLYRVGGEVVMVSQKYPNGLTRDEFRELPQRDQRLRWWQMTRDPRAYAKGTVKHSDHATIFLDGWHEVAMNTETQAQAMRDVAFLD